MTQLPTATQQVENPTFITATLVPQNVGMVVCSYYPRRKSSPADRTPNDVRSTMIVGNLTFISTATGKKASKSTRVFGLELELRTTSRSTCSTARHNLNAHPRC